MMIGAMKIKKATLRVFAGLVLAFWGAVFIGCDCDDCRVVVVDTPPDAPQGVYSVTGDRAVYLYWYESPEPDLSHYWVWRSDEAMEGPYERKWKTFSNYFVDRTVLNGYTYYYAVTAVDVGGLESEELSRDDVQDTPRPEGRGVKLWDVTEEPAVSGFDFKNALVRAWDHRFTDVFFEYDSDLGAFFVWAASELTDIQDYGYTESLDELDWAPMDGWSRVGWLELILGHSYYVWTEDDHYAKFRADDIDYRERSVMISWAYQMVTGWPELAPPPRPEHLPGYASGEKLVDADNLE
jgi:hypothetical protein